MDPPTLVRSGLPQGRSIATAQSRGPLLPASPIEALLESAKQGVVFQPPRLGSAECLKARLTLCRGAASKLLEGQIQQVQFQRVGELPVAMTIPPQGCEPLRHRTA